MLDGLSNKSNEVTGTSPILKIDLPCCSTCSVVAVTRKITEKAYKLFNSGLLSLRGINFIIINVRILISALPYVSQLRRNSLSVI